MMNGMVPLTPNRGVQIIDLFSHSNIKLYDLKIILSKCLCYKDFIKEFSKVMIGKIVEKSLAELGYLKYPKLCTSNEAPLNPLLQNEKNMAPLKTRQKRYMLLYS